MSAPNLLRIGATENIFVECQACSGGDLNFQILVTNFPTESFLLASTTGALTKKNNFQAFAEIKVLLLFCGLYDHPVLPMYSDNFAKAIINLIKYLTIVPLIYDHVPSIYL